MNETPRTQPGQTGLPGDQPEFRFRQVPMPPSYPPRPRTASGPGYGRQQYVPGDPEMPQRVRTARIVLFVLSGLLIVLGLAALAQAELAQSVFDTDSGSSGLWPPSALAEEQAASARVVVAQAGMIWAAVYAAVALVLALRFGAGGKPLRIGTIVYGAWHGVVGAFTIGFATAASSASTVLSSLVGVTAGVLLIVLMAHRDGVAWFGRPRS
ncbi:hypothetical protein [Streptomyces sp. NBC_00102]|uniref:hypothetical protein n=1 Tax=Streptomyces sp. NBC_00102 TaxID=2975652 RepID=UPI0022531CC4|nr:hypothetical protein [Streptomyces sp. NBC_00102]MCX5398945.1 hypothetical protein [Streptomyces sp. NBC_00102]